jgi:IS66 C-terminal element
MVLPQAWLADVLAHIADAPQTQLADLLPWNWAPELNLPRAALTAARAGARSIHRRRALLQRPLGCGLRRRVTPFLLSAALLLWPAP